MRRVLLFASLAMLAACQTPTKPSLDPLPATQGDMAAAPPRVNGDVGSPEATPAALTSYGTGSHIPTPGKTVVEETSGDISLDFADTDLRQAVTEILGNILKVNYTIDPS